MDGSGEDGRDCLGAQRTDSPVKQLSFGESTLRPVSSGSTQFRAKVSWDFSWQSLDKLVFTENPLERDSAREVFLLTELGSDDSLAAEYRGLDDCSLGLEGLKRL